MRQVVSGSPSPSLGEEGGADSQLPIVMLKGQQSSQKVLAERIAQIMEKTESEIDELVAEEVRDCCLPALIEIVNALFVPPRLIAHLCSDGPVQVEAEVYAEMKASRWYQRHRCSALQQRSGQSVMFLRCFIRRSQARA